FRGRGGVRFLVLVAVTSIGSATHDAPSSPPVVPTAREGSLPRSEAATKPTCEGLPPPPQWGRVGVGLMHPCSSHPPPDPLPQARGGELARSRFATTTRSAGELDRRLVGVAPVEDGDAAHRSGERGAGLALEGADHRFALVALHLREADLDELVVGQRLAGRADDRLADSVFSDLNQRLEVVRERAEVPLLSA